MCVQSRPELVRPEKRGSDVRLREGLAEKSAATRGVWSKGRRVNERQTGRETEREKVEGAGKSE
jgi:hypothetical protein